jgi:hypothetical protein
MSFFSSPNKNKVSMLLLPMPFVILSRIRRLTISKILSPRPVSFNNKSKKEVEEE